MFALFDNIRLSLGTLAANPLRSLLTLLGIIIGVSTVVTMMGLIEGLRIKVNSDLADLGADVFQVQKFPHGFNVQRWDKFARRKNMTMDDVVALRGLPDVQQVGGEAWTGGEPLSSHSQAGATSNVAISGGTPEFMENNSLTLLRGRFITEDDMRDTRPVVVIGLDVADALFPGADPIGQEVMLGKSPLTVVGLYVRQGMGMGGFSKDNIITVPMSVFYRQFGKARSINITVMAKSTALLRKAQDEVTTALRRRRQVAPQDENDFEMFTNESSTEVFNQLSASISAAGAAVCLLSLIVGGIGILNIMLVSVSERTNEIGVRKALGARKRRILVQFTIEAMVLSLLGGVIGVAVGLGLAALVRELFSIPAQVPAWSIGLGLGVSTATGLIFGIYPAYRAAGLDPASAMRST